MRSQWSHYKEQALVLRADGLSIRTIEKQLKIPRSTLSRWFSDVQVSEEQLSKLKNRQMAGLVYAQMKAAEWHHAQKQLRFLSARQEALRVLDKIPIETEILDLALSMIYFARGVGGESGAFSSSNPRILKLYLSVLRNNYNISSSELSCGLYLRSDQSPEEIIKYWSEVLDIPRQQFKQISIDKRNSDKPTNNLYKGVCMVRCGNIAIQRKMIYLYNLFCEKVENSDVGA
jgi:hypothetical protein